MKKILFFLPFVCLFFQASAQKKARLKDPLFVCDSALFNYTIVPSVKNQAFKCKWVRDQVSGISNERRTDTLANINEFLHNTTSSPILVKYAITLTINGCDHTDTLQVVVNPTPHLLTVKSLFVCDSALLSYQPVSSVSGSTFSWKRPVVGGILNESVAGVGAVQQVLKSNVNLITKVPLFFETSANGCVGKDTVWASVVPKPFGQISLIPADTVVSGQEQKIKFMTSDTIRLWHQWQFGDGQFNNTFSPEAKHHFLGKESGWKVVSNQIINRYGCVQDFKASVFVNGDATPKPVDTIAVVRNYSMAIYPVPYTTDLWLKYSLTQEYKSQLTVHDLAGRVVINQPLVLKPGNQKIKLPVDKLTRGVVYVLRIRSGSINYEDKFYKK